MALMMDVPEKINDLCRTCATETIDGSRYFIFEGEGILRNIHQKLKVLLVEITQSDRLPQVMCEECVYKLDILHEFIEQIKSTETHLKDLLSCQSTIVKVEPDICHYEDGFINEGDSNSMHHQELEFLCIKEEPAETSLADLCCKNKNVDNPSNQTILTSTFVFETKQIETQGAVPVSEIDHSSGNTLRISFKQQNTITKLNSGSEINKGNTGNERNLQVVQKIYRCMYCQLLLPTLESSAAHILQVHNINITPANSFMCIPQSNKAHASLKPILPRLPPLVYTKPSSHSAMQQIKNNTKVLTPSIPVISKGILENKKNAAAVQTKKSYPLNHSSTNISCQTVAPTLPPLLITNFKNYSASIRKSTEKDLLPLTVQDTNPSNLRFSKDQNSPKQLLSLANQHTLAKNMPVLQTLLKKENKFKKSLKGESIYYGHECHFCYISFPLAEALKLHTLKHHLKEFECEFCKFRFNSNELLVDHLKNNEGPHILPPPHSWKCSECGKGYLTKYKIRAHLRIHSGERPFTCGFCSKAFAAKTTLQMHERIHNKDWSAICSYCGKGFYYTENLNSHVRSKHTLEKPYKCDQCDSCYASKTFLKYHIINKHRVATYSNKKIECKICFKQFKEKNGLYCHKRIHKAPLDERRIHKCLVCDHSFVSKKYLTRHMQIHTGERIEKFECNMCGKKLYTARGLELHLLIHSGVKNFVCDFCSKAFASVSNLRTHVRIHTGEKPHQCRICLKSFSQRSSLIMHLQKIHDVDDRVRNIRKS